MRDDEKSELSLSILYICVKNLVMVAFFCYLAVLFNHWWIVLFALIFQSSPKIYAPTPNKTSKFKSETVDAVVCDRCGEVLIVSSMENVVKEELPKHGWRRVKIEEKWMTLCKQCAEDYSK